MIVVTVYYLVVNYTEFCLFHDRRKDCHCAHIHVFYEVDKPVRSRYIHIANSISVSFRIEGMVVFAIFRLLQRSKFFARF